MQQETPYPPQVWEARQRQVEHVTLGTLFEAMYTLCDRILATFFLPDSPEMVMPLITLDEEGTTSGSFRQDTSLGLGPVINLNPWGRNRNGEEMAETLAHECLHLWEHHVGKPTTNNRHTYEFHERMWALFGIRTTGTSARHGGHDERWDEFLQMQEDLHLDWFQLPGPKVRRKQFKHECPWCGSSFWSRTKMNVLCGDCHRPGVQQARFVIQDDGSDETDQKVD